MSVITELDEMYDIIAEDMRKIAALETQVAEYKLVIADMKKILSQVRV
jgi:hypothetical protein